MAIIRNRRKFLDPFANDVVLYVKGDGVNNGTTFTDSSQYNHSISRGGTGTNQIVTSTNQSKLGGSSLYSPANNADTCLSITNSSAFNIGTKDFTIEFWYYKTGSTYLNGTAELFTLDGLDFPLGIYDIGKILAAWGTNSSWSVPSLLDSDLALPLNQWVHVAFCRKNGTAKGFRNGVSTYQISDSSSIATAANNPSLMGSRGTTFYGAILGYIDSFRFTMAGRYDTNFNPETDTYME